MPYSNFVEQSSKTENTPELQTFWVKKYQNLLDENYFILNSKTVELLEEDQVVRPATPFGDLILGNHLENGEINEALLQENIETSVRFLDALLEVIKFDQNSRQIVGQYRKIGLGVSGFASYYKDLEREKSESEEIDYIGNIVSNNVYRSSESLSEEKGLCQNWDNIKKILRNKPFEYWYDTESGDIKSSSEMSEHFNQETAENSNFEIVPRRNSHLLLFPAVKEWQVWSDREMKIEKNSTEMLKNEKLISNTLPDLNQKVESEQNLPSFSSLQNSEVSENIQPKILVNNQNQNANLKSEKIKDNEMEMPENEKSRNLAAEKVENQTWKTEGELQKLQNLKSENLQNLPNNSENSINLLENGNEARSFDQFNQSNEATIISFPKNKSAETLKTKNPESEQTNNFQTEGEKVTELPNSKEMENLKTGNLETENSSDQIAKAEKVSLENENPYSENTEKLSNSENPNLHNFFNSKEAEKLNQTDKTEKLANPTEISKLQNSVKNKEIIENSPFEEVNSTQNSQNPEESRNKQNSQSEQVENKELRESKLQNLESAKNPSETENLEMLENQSLSQNSNSQSETESSLQLGELVKIVNQNSPLLGQIHQIVDITPGSFGKPTFQLSGSEFGESEENLEDKNLQLWQENDLEAVDLHGLLGKINNEKVSEIIQPETSSKNLEIEKTLGIDKLTTGQKIGAMSEIITDLENQKNNLNFQMDKFGQENANLKSEIIKAHDQTKILEREISKKENSENSQMPSLTNSLISGFANNQQSDLEKNSSSNSLENEKSNLKLENEKLVENQKNLQNQIAELSQNLDTEIVKSQNLDVQIAQKDAIILELENQITKIGQNQKSVSDLDSEPNSQSNLDQKLANLQAGNPAKNSKTTHPLSQNFFQFSNKIISFMSKYSLQLQQLASTSGDFQLGDILITLQYDGGGVKLVSASGDKLSKELKHMVDTVLGIVNKALSFGVPAKELAIQLGTTTQDGILTPLDFILQTIGVALNEAPEKSSNFSTDNLLEIKPEDVKIFTETPGASALSILKEQLSKLQNSKGEKNDEKEPTVKNTKTENSEPENANQENSEVKTQSDEENKPKNNVSNFDRNFEESEENPFTNSQKNIQNSQNDNELEQKDGENNISNFNRNSQNTQDEEKSKQEEKPRSFFGGFGGRN